MDEKWGKQEKSGDHVLLNYGYASLLNPIFEEIKAVWTSTTDLFL